MAYGFFVLIALCASVNGLAFQAPEATTHEYGLKDESRWTPVPTRAPRPHELLKRQNRFYATYFLAGGGSACGYTYSSPNASPSVLSCGDSETCNFWPAATTSTEYGRRACCNSSNLRCQPIFNCVNSRDYANGACGSACQQSTQTLKCTQSNQPHCNTFVFKDADVKGWYCGSQLSSTVDYYSTLRIGQSSAYFSALYVDITSTISSTSGTTSSTITPSTSSSTTSADELSKSSSTTRDIVNTSSSATPSASVSITPAPPPDPKPNTPTGAIAGGAVGGVALLALLGLALFLLKRRKRNSTPVAGINDNYSAKSPQETSNSEMFRSAGIDSNDIAKLPVLKVSERGSTASPYLVTDEQLRGLPEIR